MHVSVLQAIFKFGAEPHPHRTLFSDDNFLLFYCNRKHAA